LVDEDWDERRRLTGFPGDEQLNFDAAFGE